MLLQLLLLTVTAVDVKPDLAYEPTSAYREQRVEGWLVRVNKTLDEKDKIDLRDKVLRVLGDQLFQITRVLPPAPLGKLQKIVIWVELAHPKHPCMCYHPSKDWLKSNGMNPDKAGSVELANCRAFLNWTVEQPWMVFHEMAHGYHHQVLTFEHAGVKACYDEAKKAGIYDSVLNIDGHKRKRYALTDVKEYFAELSESFFGTNDFYPFVKAELKEVDPRMHDLLGELWGVTKPKAKRDQ